MGYSGAPSSGLRQLSHNAASFPTNTARTRNIEQEWYLGKKSFAARLPTPAAEQSTSGLAVTAADGLLWEAAGCVQVRSIVRHEKRVSLLRVEHMQGSAQCKHVQVIKDGCIVGATDFDRTGFATVYARYVSPTPCYIYFGVTHLPGFNGLKQGHQLVGSLLGKALAKHVCSVHQHCSMRRADFLLVQGII